MTAPGPRGTKAKRLDPFLMRVVVMVDEATEPGISDDEGERKRVELVNIVLDRGLEKSSLPTPITAITGGQAVAFALRKRLKSEDEVAVLNTLTLLDELMRTCPYFYRFIANEKFFRRLWRFVVPDYKNGVKSMIPIFGKARIHQGMRGGGSEISERVRILIRAWAEELSVMHNGRYDPDAGFLIERYNNKRSRVAFPEVPRTPLPWVCPVGRSSTEFLRSGASSRRGGSSKEEKITMTLAEVENTVNLFVNLVENAASVNELKEEVCADMAERCSYIKENLSRMSMNMSKEEELTRAIAISETLEKALGQYKSSLENGHIVRNIPTVDTISLQSEDEGYDDLDRNGDSSHSLDRYNGPGRSDPRPREPEQRSRRYSESSDHSSGALDGYDVRDRSYRPRERSYSPAPPQRTASSEKRRPSNLTTEKRSRRPPAKSPLNRRQKSDSDLPKLAKEKKKAASASTKKKEGLIQIPDEEAEDSSEEDLEQTNDGSFAILAERYSAQKSSRKEKSTSSSRSRKQNGDFAPKPSAQPSASPDNAANTSSSSMPPLPAAGVNPGAMYHSTGPGGMGYNPMMMVPNPYAMYGSVGQVPMPADPMGMYGAYQTVNPAMYYNTVNPQMYASHHMQMIPGMQTPTAYSTPGAQTPAIQNTPAQSPQLQSMSHQSPPQKSATQSTPQQALLQQASVPPQSPLLKAGGQLQTQAPMSNPGMTAMAMPGQPMSSFYASAPGQNPMMAQGSFPFMMQPASAPAPFPQVTQGDMSRTPSGMVPQAPQQTEADAQAAVYHSAMQQAAAAYHAAANAYRSVSGQAPIGAPSQALPGPQPPAEQSSSAEGQ